VGASGEPGFQGGSSNFGSTSGLNVPGVSFLKDQNNIVHLEGVAKVGKSGAIPGALFQLPAGDRPPSGNIVLTREAEGNTVLIVGSNVVISGMDISGLVIVSSGTENTVLTGQSFFSGS